MIAAARGSMPRRRQQSRQHRRISEPRLHHLRRVRGCIGRP
jgi:hypothetical protein